jgi:hypothetical protein
MTLARGEVLAVDLSFPQRERLRLLDRAATEAARTPDIRGEARTLAEGLPSRRGRAARALTWVQAFRYASDPAGVDILADPVATLRAKAGDCAGLSALYLSILRAWGIPARLVGVRRPCDPADHVIVSLDLGPDGWSWADAASQLPLGQVSKGIPCLLPETAFSAYAPGMGWTDFTVIDTGPGTEDVPGFSQSVNIPAAEKWIMAAVKRTSTDREAAAAAGNWALQLKTVQDAFIAIQNVYRALNLNWTADPVARWYWATYWGSWLPVDPSPTCTAETPGPYAVVSQHPDWWPRLPINVGSRNSPDGRAWTAAHPNVHGGMWDRLAVSWSMLAPGRSNMTETVQQEVWNEQRWRFSQSQAAASELGQPMPTPPADLPPPVYETVTRSTFNPIIVVPAFLDFRSMARVLDTSSPHNGTAGQKFESIFSGAWCRTAEVPRDTSAWSWDCGRWDDTPGTGLRIVTPLRWSFEYARDWAQNLRERGPLQIVMDARIHQVLENIERAKEFSADLSNFDTALYETLQSNRQAVHNSAKDRATAAAVLGPVCGAATLAGGVPGAVCALAAVGADALFALVPRGVGCWWDEWGQLLPSPVRAQLSLSDPPDFTVPMPDDPKLVVPRWPEPSPLRIDPRTVGPVPPRPTVSQVPDVMLPYSPPPPVPQLPKTPAGTPPPVTPPVPPAQPPEQSGSGAGPAIALAVAGWGLSKVFGGRR